EASFQQPEEDAAMGIRDYRQDDQGGSEGDLVRIKFAVEGGGELDVGAHGAKWHRDEDVEGQSTPIRAHITDPVAVAKLDKLAGLSAPGETQIQGSVTFTGPDSEKVEAEGVKYSRGEDGEADVEAHYYRWSDRRLKSAIQPLGGVLTGFRQR